ncbi:hypothetical protein ABZ756_04510 [Mammaliicoccus sciuri]|uniref:Uncharacterized protein n=1 Tax=Sporosarcina newyorkensis TaxID=759851 RepID=A0A1T4XRA0_9BACL|nr:MULTISPECIES: hypothetical protein [Sporosarcina]MBY0222329.1 hypothetical protein [Sporosarcina aquimarina]SKA92077.1 hypothetical protein SAMN04244570_1241 [Sporosarcina newyorkensis]
MNKTLKEQLIEKGLVQLVKQAKVKKDTRTSKKRNERLSERDWRKLMGSNMPTYGRKKG